jgi:formate dehydrogenase major subunit
VSVTIAIDGKEYTAEKGETILGVAQRYGIAIPTLCHSTLITKNTACFVCIVKDSKTGRFVPSCAMEVSDGMRLESESDEVRDMRMTALNLILSEHSGDCEAPCTIACPAHAKVEEYVREGKKGNHLEALKLIKERIPLPMSIGRVCPRFCEKDCRRNVVDKEAVAINDFKRLAADLHYENYMEDLPALSGKKVAIVGAGPAGLSVAYFLRLNGVESDLFDKMPEAGGMLRYGIPEYRLPKTILDKEIAHFGKMGGITFNANKELGKNLSLDDLRKDYNAVAITIGSWKSSAAGVEGEALAVGGIQFLEKLALNGWKGANPGKTIVIGGGNTAMDCLRCAVRLGSNDVSCFYRRTEAEIPAEKIEIHEAKEEGVKFEYLVAPVSMRRKNGRLILTSQRMTLGESDASGRRKPVPVPGSDFDTVADTVIAAIGQKTSAPVGLKSTKWGDVDVNTNTCEMENQVFAAGDCVSGPATVVEAVAGARRAALAIIACLEGSSYSEPYQLNVTRGAWQGLKNENLVFLKEPLKRMRQAQRFIPLQERTGSFREVSFTYTAEEIAKEGERCIECSCAAKNDCSLRKQCEKYNAKPDFITGEKPQFGYDVRHPEIILDRGKCIKCGICVKVCSEIVNENLLGFKFRGFSTHIDTAFSQPLPSALCRDCGKCIEECPVGALDWKLKT